jgi:hypothetical protein
MVAGSPAFLHYSTKPEEKATASSEALVAWEYN